MSIKTVLETISSEKKWWWGGRGVSKDGFKNLGLSDLKILYYYIYMMSVLLLFLVSTMSKPVC